MSDLSGIPTSVRITDTHNFVEYIGTEIRSNTLTYIRATGCLAP